MRAMVSFFLMFLMLLTVVTDIGLAQSSAPNGTPMPDPRIEETTLIQGTGWSSGSSRNESLACDVAQQRAIKHLNKGIAFARQKQMVTAEELMVAILQPAQRVWNAEAGRCVIRLELAVPVLPKRSIPIVHERQY